MKLDDVGRQERIQFEAKAVILRTAPRFCSSPKEQLIIVVPERVCSSERTRDAIGDSAPFMPTNNNCGRSRRRGRDPS